MNIFVKRVKELREEYGFNQKELAEASGISRSGICTLESGNQNPNIQTAIALARTFHVSIDYLVGLSDSEYGIEYEDPYSNEEKQIIRMIRKLPKSMKDNVFQMIESLAGEGSKKKYG